MKTTLKTLSIATICLVVAMATYGMYKLTIGNYQFNAPFMFGFILVAYLLLLTYAKRGIRKIWTLVIIASLTTLQSCNYAKSNQQVVVSDDCGMTWKKINAGEAVPKAGLNMCYMKVVIPNFPMQGEATFISNLKDKVRANVHIDYDYSITDALAFIKQAKFLGKANVDADNEEAIGKSFEMAENMVIDKRIKDVAKRIFVDEDIVELDQSEIENHLLTESNKALESLGVHLNFITLSFDLDEQTRQAIDVSTAMKIYESKNLQDIGKQVMSQRAGATKITVENKTETPKSE
ncbi:hypothetical protein [Sphingobacterium sp. UGAL515B_05]|uniref:hypothetical protein n=1 Tax=Sphingobacterium sp. UGAL515B_05 TaxID=2986767 RepID=UPI0029547631|nr:hypothetical protein [Sphingobacterium sp. UGAL515B_05]WON93879.1 hypothetical protein OK025_21840 [Sphingobacterium sp. UGAL515B_05]